MAGGFVLSGTVPGGMERRSIRTWLVVEPRERRLDGQPLAVLR